MEIPQEVTNARSEAARLGKVASDYAASEYTIPDQLKKTVQEALNYNKDVIGMRSTALADYMSAPAVANKKFGVQTFSAGEQAGQTNPDFIFNPFERNAAIQSYIGNQSIPFSTANALLGMREGTIADTVNAGTRAFQAQSAASQAAAQAARQTYQDVLGEFGTVEDIKLKQQQLAQEQQKIDLERYKAEKAGGGTGASIEELLALLTQADQGTVDTSGLENFVEEEAAPSQQSAPQAANKNNWQANLMNAITGTKFFGEQKQTPALPKINKNPAIRGLSLDFGSSPASASLR